MVSGAVLPVRVFSGFFTDSWFQGLIYRFKAMMLSTVLLAAMTIIFFVVSQVSEGHWKWGEENKLEYTSAFFTGEYITNYYSQLRVRLGFHVRVVRGA